MKGPRETEKQELALEGSDSSGTEHGNYCTYPTAPSYLNSRLLGYVTIGYIELSSHYLGNWSPRVYREIDRVKKRSSKGATWGK